MPAGKEPTEAPRANYVCTALVGVLLLLAAVLAFLLQVLAVAFTWPCLLCGVGGRDRFRHIQSLIYRGVLTTISVGLNPLWCTQCHWVGATSGPPDIVPGSVIFCNHRSNSDPFVAAWLLVRTGVECRYIYKSSLGKIPFLGWSSVLAGDLAVHFGDKKAIVAMLDRAREVLRRGYHICVFPEGTRSPSGILQDFKPSFFEICAELGCPAVPMCLVGSERAWPHGGFKMGPATVHAAIGEPVMPGPGGARELSREIAERMRDMAREVLEDESDAETDPFQTDRPYDYWREPSALEGLGEEEKMQLLREGRAHERGAHLA